jgi:hypothetical protein
MLGEKSAFRQPSYIYLMVIDGNSNPFSSTGDKSAWDLKSELEDPFKGFSKKKIEHLKPLVATAPRPGISR